MQDQTAAKVLSMGAGSAYSLKAAMNPFGFLAPTISEIGQEQNFLGNKLGRQIDDPRSPVRPNYEFPARFTKGAVA